MNLHLAAISAVSPKAVMPCSWPIRPDGISPKARGTAQRHHRPVAIETPRAELTGERLADPIEDAWTYRYPARLSRPLQIRQESLLKAVREIAWKA